MTLSHIAISNLRRRKGKSAFVLLGLAIAVAAVVAFVILADSLVVDVNEKLDQYGANVLIAPRSETLSLSYGGLSLGGVSFDVQEIDQKDLQLIRSIENSRNIAAIGPMVLGPVDVAGHTVLLAGIDMEASRILRPWWDLLEALPPENGLVVGADASVVLGLHPGGRAELAGMPLTVAKVLEPTGSQDDQMLFLSLPVAQRLLRKEGKITMAEVAALCSDCPIEEIVRQVSEVLPRARVTAVKQVVESRMAAVSQMRRFGYALVSVVAAAGGLVVLVTMMGSVRERISEIGIMRAVGFRSSHVARVVLLEAAVLSAVAGVLGFAVGTGAATLGVPLFTESEHIIVIPDPLLAGAAVLLAVILGLGSSLYPALIAARLDPTDALRAL